MSRCASSERTVVRTLLLCSPLCTARRLAPRSRQFRGTHAVDEPDVAPRHDQELRVQRHLRQSPTRQLTRAAVGAKWQACRLAWPGTRSTPRFRGLMGTEERLVDKLNDYYHLSLHFAEYMRPRQAVKLGLQVCNPPMMQPNHMKGDLETVSTSCRQ